MFAATGSPTAPCCAACGAIAGARRRNRSSCAPRPARCGPSRPTTTSPASPASRQWMSESAETFSASSVRPAAGAGIRAKATTEPAWRWPSVTACRKSSAASWRRGDRTGRARRLARPDAEALLPDPSHLKDMDSAAARIAAPSRRRDDRHLRRLRCRRRDLHGAAAAVLRGRGRARHDYIPDRMKEGYGPNAPALLSLKQRGAAWRSRWIAASPPSRRWRAAEGGLE